MEDGWNRTFTQPRGRRGGPPLTAGPASRCWAAVGAVLAAALLYGAPACSSPAGPRAAASIDGYELTAAQVRDEFERVRGQGSWTSASVSEREDFAHILLDKQM
ncbi:MAG: hypothetical protein KC729_08845, partial [Candidatus Eisenbacteria bacterium]|nr:hypothetical protein [Candidatus Eisenbacteria bacterium]